MLETLRRLILSPCGTSLLTNNTSSEIRSLVFKYANLVSPVSGEEGKKLSEHIKERKNYLLTSKPEEAAKLSAEINGIYRIYNENLASKHDDIHILLATDTWLGKETAKMVKDWLEKQRFSQIQVWDNIAGLRTDSLDNFHCAIAELVKHIHQVLPDYKRAGYRIIFNLTGGFKSIQGVLQTLAQFYADEAVYIFESSEELLRIPRIPISLEVVTSIKNALNIWRRLALGLPVSREEIQAIPDSFLIEIDYEITLSPWGELVWQQSKRKIYEECLWPPPSERISWTREFEKTVNELPPDRRYEINKRLDELALHLEKPEHPNPGSLNCHKLRGKPLPGCTHEIYAWSDRDAARIYGRCFGHERFEIEKLEKHL
ncbi:putative CRISPR-associated protein [Thermodesulfatator atlanticus]